VIVRKFKMLPSDLQSYFVNLQIGKNIKKERKVENYETMEEAQQHFADTGVNPHHGNAGAGSQQSQR
jgi:hypothetical protein